MYVCLGSENTLDMHVCNLGSKIPWICMYIAKIPHKNIHNVNSLQKKTNFTKKT